MSARPGYTWGERQRRARFVEQWRGANGSLCVGYQRAAHMVDETTNPLTADHIVPVAAGGDEGGPLQVLCRSCNATKQDGKQRARPVGESDPERCPHAGRVVGVGEYGGGLPRVRFTHPADCPYGRVHSFHSRPW